MIMYMIFNCNYDYDLEQIWLWWLWLSLHQGDARFRMSTRSLTYAVLTLNRLRKQPCYKLFYRQESKKLDVRNPTPTKSCIMIGTQKIVKTFSKILLCSALYRAKKFKRIPFLRKMLVLLLQFFMQLPDYRAIYRWNELLKRKRMTHYLSIYVFIW